MDYWDRRSHSQNILIIYYVRSVQCCRRPGTPVTYTISFVWSHCSRFVSVWSEQFRLPQWNVAIIPNNDSLSQMNRMHNALGARIRSRNRNSPMSDVGETQFHFCANKIYAIDFNRKHILCMKIKLDVFVRTTSDQMVFVVCAQSNIWACKLIVWCLAARSMRDYQTNVSFMVGIQSALGYTEK